MHFCLSICHIVLYIYINYFDLVIIVLLSFIRTQHDDLFFFILNPGTIDAIVKMIRYEGLHGFYKGMGTKIVQSVFAASVLFMLKEELVKFFLFIARRRHIKAIKSRNR